LMGTEWHSNGPTIAWDGKSKKRRFRAWRHKERLGRGERYREIFEV